MRALRSAEPAQAGQGWRAVSTPLVVDTASPVDMRKAKPEPKRAKRDRAAIKPHERAAFARSRKRRGSQWNAGDDYPLRSLAVELDQDWVAVAGSAFDDLSRATYDRCRPLLDPG